MLYNYLETAFNLIAGLINNNSLIICVLVLLGLQILWVVLSLVFSSELKIAKNCKKLTKFIEKNGINEQTEPKMVELVNCLPKQFARQFKVWKSLNYPLPSLLFNQSDCIDTPLYGGVFIQNKSIMRTVTNGVVILLSMLSLVLAVGSEGPISAMIIAKALIIPMTALLVFKVVYYVYIAIRKYYYKLAVETFNELLDVLNEKFELGEIKLKNDLVNNYNIDLLNQINEIKKGNKMEQSEVKRGRGRPRKTEEEKNAPLKVETEEDFAKALARAEKLMARLHKPLSDSQKRRTNKELAEIMDLLAQYKKKKK